MEPGNAPHAFDVNSELYEFLTENIQKHNRIVGGNEVSGTRSHRVERTRPAAYSVVGAIAKNIAPAEFDTLLIKILGNNESPTDQFNVSEDIPYFGILIDRDYSTFEYKNCKVDKAILRGKAPDLMEEGEPDLLTLELHIIGSEEAVGTSWPGSPPSLGTSLAYNPLTFQDSCGSVTIGGSAREITEFVVVIDNHARALFTNCLHAHSIVPRDRSIMARFRVPWNSTNAALYDANYAGATASIVLVNSTVSTTLTFGRFQPVSLSPCVEKGKDYIDMILEGRCTMVGTTREIVINNDATV